MYRGSVIFLSLAVLVLTPLAGLRAATLTAPAPLQLNLPLDYQVHQRATSAEGKITIAGALPKDGPDPDTVEARLGGAGAAQVWQKLATIKPGMTEFRGELRAPAGGWLRLEVRVMRQDTVAAEATVEHVSIGEVFVIAGQSNAANHGEEKQKTKSGLVAAFSEGKWQLAHDPQPGASGSGGSFIPPFGDAIAERFKVPWASSPPVSAQRAFANGSPAEDVFRIRRP
jgi:hypothetical protein